MRFPHIEPHLNDEELKQKMDCASTVGEHRRWQAIRLLQRGGIHAQEAAEIVGVKKSTVHKWVVKYNHGGPETLESKPQGGRTTALMSLEEEREFLAGLNEKAGKGLVIVAKTVKAEAEAYLGREVSKDYAYDLLHRHGWRKIEPRPRHPKRDKEKQEEFKKNSRIWFPRRPKTSRKRIKGP